MKRAHEVNGLFVDGADHTSYNIDGVVYEDALRFSRDNLFISNRPGEFTDAQKYFHLTNDSALGLNVSLWLVPVTNTTETGAPIGMTSGSSSRSFLERGVVEAQARLDNVTVSADGSDVPSSQEWVDQTVYDQLDEAVARANLSLSLPTARPSCTTTRSTCCTRPSTAAATTLAPSSPALAIPASRTRCSSGRHDCFLPVTVAPRDPCFSFSFSF